MGLNAANASSGGKKFEYIPVPAGTYPGYLVQVIDIGMQPRSAWKGEEKAPMQHIILTYELSDEFSKDEDGQELEDKPRWISETLPLFNLSADNANSTIRYGTLDPNSVAGGDFSKLLGTPINVTVVNNPGKGKNVGRTFDKVAGLAGMRAKDVEKMNPLKNTPKFFDLDSPDMSMFQDFPKWVQEKIKANLQYEGSILQTALAGGAGTGAKVDTKEPKIVEGDDTPF